MLMEPFFSQYDGYFYFGTCNIRDSDNTLCTTCHKMDHHTRMHCCKNIAMAIIFKHALVILLGAGQLILLPIHTLVNLYLINSFSLVNLYFMPLVNSYFLLGQLVLSDWSTRTL